MKKKIFSFSLALTLLLSSCSQINDQVSAYSQQDNIVREEFFFPEKLNDTTQIKSQSLVSSFFVTLGKQATKKLIKEAFEKTVKVSLKKFEFNVTNKVKIIGDKRFREILEEADNALTVINPQEPLWIKGIAFIPVVGDIFDVAKILTQLPDTVKALRKIEALVKESEKRLQDIDALKGQWNKVNYDSIESSLGYHADKHGFGDILTYMRQAEAYTRNLKGATKVPKELENGEMGTLYKKDGKFIILDKANKIVTFGKN